jgi:large subunit ribosomal protein L15
MIKMTTNRRKKVTRRRAHTTHGFGSMKKNRGAGNRGGRGRAGSGKKGDAQKTFFRVKHKFQLGKNGFGKRVVKINAMNLSDLEKRSENLIKSGVMTKKNDTYAINLADIKVNKLLGSGNTELKFEITVDSASKLAIEKIEKAGGKVTVKDRKLENVSEAENVEETAKEE